MDKLAGPGRAKHIKNGRHPRQKIRKLAGLCSYKDNSDFASLEVLLILHPSVERQKDLKSRLSPPETTTRRSSSLPNLLQGQCGIHVQADDS